MRTYVVQDTPVRFGRGAKDVKLYAPGDEMRLSDGEAKALGDAVRPGTGRKRSGEAKAVTAPEQAGEQTGGSETAAAPETPVADASATEGGETASVPGARYERTKENGK